MIKLKAFDIYIITLESFANFVFLSIPIFGSIYYRDNLFVYISIVLFVGSLIFKLIYYFKKNMTIIIDQYGMKYKVNDKDIEITWENIVGIHYSNLWFIFMPNELVTIIKIDKKTVVFSDLYDVNIHISKRKYKKVIKLIPKQYLEKNDFLIYPNIVSRKKDKYKIYN